MRQLTAILDPNSNPLVGLSWSDYIDHRVLAANTAEVHTVPAGARYVLMSGSENFYARMNAAAAVPVADVADGTGSMINPGLRSLAGVTTIGLIAAAECIVSLEFYS